MSTYFFISSSPSTSHHPECYGRLSIANVSSHLRVLEHSTILKPNILNKRLTFENVTWNRLFLYNGKVKWNLINLLSTLWTRNVYTISRKRIINERSKHLFLKVQTWTIRMEMLSDRTVAGTIPTFKVKFVSLFF